MPYIPSHQRIRLDDEVDALIKALNGFPRELLDGAANYALTRVVQGTFLNTTEDRRPSYRDHAGAQGLLSCVALELYRRKTAPYETVKIRQNGDLDRCADLDAPDDES